MAEEGGLKGSILVLDDCRLTLAYFSDVLTGAGYRVQATASVMEANSLLSRETPPDLLLVDVEMPLLRGDRMVSVLKTGTYPLKTPVLLMSSKPVAEMRTLCHDSGADGFLVKPADPDTILTTVQRAFGPSR